MDLKIGSKLHGFTLRERVELPEIKAVMYRMAYEKNGADLIELGTTTRPLPSALRPPRRTTPASSTSSSIPCSTARKNTR